MVALWLRGCVMSAQDNLLAPDVLYDPYVYFAGLRETDAVHWNERWGGWLILRYDDVVKVFRDHETFSSDRMASLMLELNAQEQEHFALLINYFSKWLVFTDPPYHTRVRLLINKAFTPTSVEKLRPRARQIVQKLLAQVRLKSHMEFIHDFAFHLPVIIISEYLGVPVEDREQVKEWSDETSRVFFIRANEPDRRERSQRGLEQLLAYFEPLIEERRKHPRDDLISALVQAEERGDLLSHEELLATCTVLLFAGHETTTNLLANGLLAFMRRRDQWDLLRQHPSLVRSAAEELYAMMARSRRPFAGPRKTPSWGGRPSAPV